MSERATRTRGPAELVLLAAVQVGLALASVGAASQAEPPTNGSMGADSIRTAIERVMPQRWEIVTQIEGKVPTRWMGPADAYYIRLEDPSTNVHHRQGHIYHPYIKLYFCPRDWAGVMEECDYYGDAMPSFLLGKNHEYRVFYQTQGTLTWDDPWTALATTFDLTQSRVDRDLHQQVNAQVRTQIAQRLATVRHGLPEDVLDRILGIDRDGSLVYFEYMANVSSPPPTPGAPPLKPEVRSLVERETRLLSEEIFRLFPDVTAVYVRRLCDNRLFDELMDRSTQPVANGMGDF
jgi:hypothetical protein